MVNNAGGIPAGRSEVEILELNLRSALVATGLAVEHGAQAVMNIASVAGIDTVPHDSPAYAAAKAGQAAALLPRIGSGCCSMPEAMMRWIPFGGMGLETHGRWPWVAAALVVPTWSLVGARRRELSEDGAWVAGLALPILVSHQSEEWVWPGGFLPFCNVRLLGSDRPDWPLTERDGFRVNVIAGWLSAVAGLVLWRRTPVVAAGVLYVEAGNVLMHVSMALRERRYNPGVLTAAMLLAPHAAAGTRWLARSGRVSRRQGRLALVAGAAFAALPLAMKLRMRGTPPPGDARTLSRPLHAA